MVFQTSFVLTLALSLWEEDVKYFNIVWVTKNRIRVLLDNFSLQFVP